MSGTQSSGLNCTMPRVHFRPTPTLFGDYDAGRFEGAVKEALAITTRVLGAAREPVLASDAPHTYDDKFLLAEAQLSAAAACSLTVLLTAGLTTPDLEKLLSWSRGGASVTLRFALAISCVFVREETRDVAGPKTVETTQHAGAFGASTSQKTTQVVTTVTDCVWTLSASWTLSAFCGTGRGVGESVVLSERTSASVNVRTTGGGGEKVPPFQGLTGARAPLEVSLDWLLSVIDTTAPGPGLLARARIDRASPSCATPRRNAEVDRALEWAAQFHGFLQGAFEDAVARSLAAISDAASADTPQARFDRGVFGSGPAFVPPLLFCAPLPTPAEADGTIVSTAITAQPAAAVVMDLTTVNSLVAEAAAGVQGRVDAARAALPVPSSTAMITVAEAALVIAGRFGRAALVHLADGLGSIEAMLRDQVIAAVGKVIQPADFDAYMRFHARKLFRPEYAPLPFCTSVRRSLAHSPEGVLRINAPPVGDAPAEAIFTVCASSVARGAAGRMDFPLSAETRVPFGGERHVHAWLAHRFSADAARASEDDIPICERTLSLVATARQFSSFIVLVGRISGPASFEPVSAFIVKDRDEVTVPLSLSEIPTPKEFKDAIASLSPEQQRFCKAFRSMQLESTLFGVLVLQVKPQLERLLNLPPDSLTKEIELTQDLTDLFIKYQIPADLLSAPSLRAAPCLTTEQRLSSVREHVAAIRAIIAKQEAAELEHKKKQEEYERPLPVPPPPPPVEDVYEEEDCDDFGAGLVNQGIELSSRLMGDLVMKEAAPSRPTFFARAAKLFGSGARTGGGASSGGSSSAPVYRNRANVRMDACEAKDEARPPPPPPPPRPSAAALLPPAPEASVGGRDGGGGGPTPPATAADRSGGSSAAGQQPLSPTGRGAGTAKDSEGAGGAAELEEEELAPARDLTLVPGELDRQYEALDADSALRATIIAPSGPWKKDSWASLLSKKKETTELDGDAQAAAKAAAFDLIDALSKSGGLPFEDAALHVVIGATHCFDAALIDAVVQDNINPIEKAERSLLIMATTLHRAPAAALVQPAHVTRLAGLTPGLFAAAAAEEAALLPGEDAC